MYFVIKVGSITNAQRASKILRSHGYKSTLTRLENPLPSDGCGYVIKVAAENSDTVVKLLKNAGVAVLGAEAV